MPTDSTQPKITMVTGVKNEAPFLLEWIAYHKVIGFNDFIIVSNDCTDGTAEILDALQDAGEIRHFPQVIPQGSAPQRNAAKIINENKMLQGSDWVCWLDADEFLNILSGDGLVTDLIAAIGDKSGMLLYWRLFGDSGHSLFPGRYISPDFTRASKRTFFKNAEVKAFFRMDDNIVGLGETGIHRPQLKPNVFTSSDFMTSSGNVINSEFHPNITWLKGVDKPDNRFAGRTSDFQSTGTEESVIAQINHYCVRTPEYYALKTARGRGWAVNGHVVSNNRHNSVFYAKMNRNDVEERSIIRFEDGTTARINQLLQNPTVAMAVENSQKLIKVELDTIMSQPPAPVVAKPKDNLHGIKLTLPDDSAALVRRVYSENKNILEYGSGGSTALALDLGADRVVSVESDKAWTDDMIAKLAPHYDQDRFLIYHADIGPTKAWGRPTHSRRYRSFHKYPAEIWDHLGDWHPDVVFIDGRFRGACFVTTMIKIKRPVTVLFDDYVNRPHYHRVEQFAKPVESAGRLVRFELEPRAFPVERFTDIMEIFSDPE